MEKNDEKEPNDKSLGEIETYPVAFSINKKQENIMINTNTLSIPSKKQIINQAIKFHIEGNILEASKYYQYCLKEGFDDHKVYSNYGIILKNSGNLEEAKVLLRKAIELKPDFADAYSNLANIFRDLGNLKEGELLLRKAINIKPDFADAYLNLGTILESRGELKEAELAYLKAIEIKPDFAQSYSNLAMILKNRGEILNAFKYLSAASKYDPNNIIHFINSNLRFSPIMKSNSQINSERSQYKKEINNLRNKVNMYYSKPKTFISSAFYLAYQNRPDDRVILEDFSDAISNVKGILVNDFSRKKYLDSSRNRKNLKVGICSANIRKNHSVGKCFFNVLKDLSKTDIDVIIYIFPDKINNSSRQEIQEIQDTFENVINLPYCPINAAKLILLDQLDLIFYPDIGMSSFSYILALSRLALVQVNGLGHGSTSGIKNIDYYITHGIEPSKSDMDYTETLIRFKRLPFNFTTPKINEDNITQDNVIHKSSNFYIGLIQSLFKLHPSYDEILVSILLKVKNSYLVFITDKSDFKFKLIQERWNKKNKLLIERSIFLNTMGRDDFLNIVRSCDIMLDPFYFGGGVTFYEAMAYGIPFVTYPHNQKVRIVYAGYKQMKIKNPPVAKSPEDYINWCKVYSEDKLLLESTKKELRQKAEKYLFNDNKIYKDYYKFFKKAVKKSREKLSNKYYY